MDTVEFVQTVVGALLFLERARADTRQSFIEAEIGSWEYSDADKALASAQAHLSVAIANSIVEELRLWRRRAEIGDQIYAREKGWVS